MKKTGLRFLLTIFMLFCCWNMSGEGLREYTLENGMKVFFLEDLSTPLVRIEYSCKAGTSAQSVQTPAFFELYSRLLAANMPKINFSQVTCGADSARFIISSSATHTVDYLEELADGIFAKSFSEDLIKEQLDFLKKEIALRGTDFSSLLNGAIDSRVFSDSPWKQESGACLELLEKVDLVQLKNTLTAIGDRWYTPQNSALFISGNFNGEKLLPVVEASFGRFYSNYKVPGQQKNVISQKDKNFVFSSSEFSKDLVQVVLQYSTLSYEETEILAEMLNKDYSYFKFNILQKESLGIPGAEYINVSAAHKGENSRLIIQTIFQKNQNLNSVEQLLAFKNLVEQGIKDSNEQEFFNAKHDYQYNFRNLKSDSNAYINKISEFWSREEYLPYDFEVFDLTNPSLLENQLLQQQKRIDSVELEVAKTIVEMEKPFVFLLTNSSEYKKNKVAYDKNGFTEVNTKNAYWYQQKKYGDILAKAKKDLENKNGGNPFSETVTPRKGNQEIIDFSADQYYEINRDSIKTQVLDNGITVSTKNNPNSPNITIMLSIMGGQLSSTKDLGFEDVMISLFAANLQKEIYRQQLQGMIVGNPVVDYQCKLCTGCVWIECEKIDFAACCKVISNALLYEEITPSAADRSVFIAQYNWRIERANLINQLYSQVIKTLYAGSNIEKLYSDAEDILENVNYQKILSKYPELLDSTRYTILLTGNLDSNYFDVLNKSLGVLNPMNVLKAKQGFQELQAVYPAKKQMSVKLVHKFFADPTLDRNAPQPAILVPTKDFYDPAMFVIRVPEEKSTERVCFEALFMYLNQLHIEEKFYLIPAGAQTDFAAIVIQNVNSKREAKVAYRKLLLEIQKLFLPELADQTVQAIKDTWISANMANSVTNTGTAELMQKGLEYFPYEKKTDYYLFEYNAIQTADTVYFQKLLSYFTQEPALEVYSTEAKD